MGSRGCAGFSFFRKNMATPEQILDLKQAMGQAIIGQAQLLERLLLASLCKANVAG